MLILGVGWSKLFSTTTTVPSSATELLTLPLGGCGATSSFMSCLILAATSGKALLGNGPNTVSESTASFPISGLQEGPAERGHVKKTQKVSKSFSTLFDNLCAGQKTSKIVKKCQKVFRHFSTFFARHHFCGPFGGALGTHTGTRDSHADSGRSGKS